MNALPIRKGPLDGLLDENGQLAPDTKINPNDLVSAMVQTLACRNCIANTMATLETCEAKAKVGIHFPRMSADKRRPMRFAQPQQSL